VIFFDTNVLVYFAINQDSRKQGMAQLLVQQAVENQRLVISPLVMIEFIFVLSKLNQFVKQERVILFFQQFIHGQIEESFVLSAYQFCVQHGHGKNINDVIHLKFAEKYCDKIITFDNDFKMLMPFSTIKIDIHN
jgi:predicted nucleic acid-binding protein